MKTIAVSCLYDVTISGSLNKNIGGHNTNMTKALLSFFDYNILCQPKDILFPSSEITRIDFGPNLTVVDTTADYTTVRTNLILIISVPELSLEDVEKSQRVYKKSFDARFIIKHISFINDNNIHLSPTPNESK